MTNNPTIDGVRLLPCPFCGQSNVLIEQLDSDASVVICQGLVSEHCACLARGPVGVQDNDDENQPGKDAAVREWNKRATPVVERQPVEFPAGAIHNGRAFIDQLESIYAFKEQQGHPLSLCSEWQELVRCFEWLANHATEAQSTIAQQKNLIESLRADLRESYAIQGAELESGRGDK